MKQTYIPKGWKLVKLKDIIQEKSERNINEQVKEVLSITNSQGFVKQEDYFEGTVHSKNIGNYKIVRKNQFAYNPSRINVGSIDILKKYEEGALSPMYIVFETDEEKLNADYFKYYFETNEFMQNVKNSTQGSVRESLNFITLSGFEYLLPPLEEQKKIASVLTNIDSIIEKLNNEVEQEKKYSQSLINKLLNNGKFEEKKMKDIVEYKKGYAFMSKEYTKNGRRIIRVSDLTEVSVKDRKEAIYINEKETCNYEDWILHENDIIITTVGSKPPIYNSMAGKSVIVPKEEDGSLLNQNNVRIRTKKEVLQLYLYYYLKQRRYTHYIECIIRGNANQGNITVDELLEYKIRFPSIKNQEMIVNVLNKIEKKVEMLQNNIKEYEKLKKGLIQQLLTGKIRVKI